MSKTAKTLTTRDGQVIILPTAKETAAINAGIAADPDTYEAGDAEFAQMRKPGRPLGSVAAVVKTPVKLRLDPDVLAAFKATGRGWQTRVNAALTKLIAQGQL